MSMMRLSEIVEACAGQLLAGEAAAMCLRVVTDSRSVQAGDVFVALRGERFDAHTFLPAVAAQGALAAVVEVAPDAALHLPCVVVSDTRLALGDIAKAWRSRFALPVVAVTGSNGKTTVKEMLAAIFAHAVGEAHRLATGGNLNNDIGLPLTVFKLNAQHRLAVLELGMNHPGETAYLASIAQATVALINNAQREHQEFMVSVEAVAEEHSAVLTALPEHGVAVFPAHTPYSAMWRAVAGARQVLDFGLQQDAVAGEAPAAVSGTWQAVSGGVEITLQTPAGAACFVLPLLGAHNVRNALAATAAALGAGVALQTITEALGKFSAVKGRLQVKASAQGAMVIDDTYNANPDSVRAAIDVLAAQVGRKILVLGDMGEVGEQGPAFHQEVGAYAKQQGVQALFTLGELAQHSAQAFGVDAQAFTDVTALLRKVQQVAAQGNATVLVKGSRFMRMERVVEGLCAAPEAPLAA